MADLADTIPRIVTNFADLKIALTAPAASSGVPRIDTDKTVAALVADADALLAFADDDTDYTTEVRIQAAAMATARYAKAQLLLAASMHPVTHLLG